MLFGRDGRWYATRDTGKAWVNAQTLQVMRLKRTFRGVPGTEFIRMRVDFDETLIDGKKFWLPRAVEGVQEEVRDMKHTTWIFTAEYTKYRKYGSKADIRFDAP